jgi:hypothetical protein
MCAGQRQAQLHLVTQQGSDGAGCGFPSPVPLGPAAVVHRRARRLLLLLLPWWRH